MCWQVDFLGYSITMRTKNSALLPAALAPIRHVKGFDRYAKIRIPGYAHVPFEVKKWRSGQNLPTEQGLVLGCKGKKGELTALVDSDDIHCLMIGASGIGKTAYFLYPNLEYACASGMSWLALDSKGDLARNYGAIAKNCYGSVSYTHLDVYKRQG